MFTNAGTLQQCITSLTSGSSVLASAERHEAHLGAHNGFDADAPTAWTDFTDDPAWYPTGWDEAPAEEAFLAPEEQQCLLCGNNGHLTSVCPHKQCPMKVCRKPAGAGHVPECKLYASYMRWTNPARGGRKPSGKGKKGRGRGYGKTTKGGRGGYKQAYNVFEEYEYPQTYDAASQQYWEDPAYGNDPSDINSQLDETTSKLQELAVEKANCIRERAQAYSDQDCINFIDNSIEAIDALHDSIVGSRGENFERAQS